MGGGEKGLGGHQTKSWGRCHPLKLPCILAVVPAMTLQSFLQEITVMMLAAFLFRVLNPMECLLQMKQLSRLFTWTLWGASS